MHSDHLHIQQIYDALWQEAQGYFQTGRVDTDPHLGQREMDRRLGLTLIARPTQPVSDAFEDVLTQLAEIAPGQYVYQPNEFHVTILSLFTATENHAPHLAKTPEYLKAVAPVLAARPRFSVDFRGLTACRGSVMVQGFPEDDHLATLRDRLREALRLAGLAEGLDERYRIATAHSTILRFASLPRDLRQLVDFLSRHREYAFGRSTFHTLQLVKNDWYMSVDRVEVLAEYALV